MEKKKYCACGCGEEVAPNRKYINRHNWNDPAYYRLMSESRKKLKERQGYLNSPETRKKMSETHKGKPCHQSKKEQKRLSEWSKNLWKDPEHREKMAECNAPGWKHTKETRKKMKVSRKELKERQGYLCSPEARKKISEASKKRWQDPEFREKTIKATFEALTIFPNKPERQLYKLLKKLFPGEYKYVGDGKILIGFKSPDFININGQKKLIELFGDYWHSKAVTGLPKKVHRKQRQEHFADYGYKCCIVWQHELKDLPKLEDKLVAFHNK